MQHQSAFKLVCTTHRFLAASFSWPAFFSTDPHRKRTRAQLRSSPKENGPSHEQLSVQPQRIALSCRATSCGTFPSKALATAQRRAATSFVALVGRAERLRSFAALSLGTRHSRPVRSFRISSPFDVSAGACSALLSATRSSTCNLTNRGAWRIDHGLGRCRRTLRPCSPFSAFPVRSGRIGALRNTRASVFRH